MQQARWQLLIGGNLNLMTQFTSVGQICALDTDPFGCDLPSL
jgi:hypothetical protein